LEVKLEIKVYYSSFFNTHLTKHKLDLK
jgi:hypothetical protein